MGSMIPYIAYMDPMGTPFQRFFGIYWASSFPNDFPQQFLRKNPTGLPRKIHEKPAETM